MAKMRKTLKVSPHDLRKDTNQGPKRTTHGVEIWLAEARTEIDMMPIQN